MTKKKPEEMTFKEYWEEEKKTGADEKVIEKERLGLLEVLRKEGFSDEQISKMKMKEVSNISLKAMERHIKNLESMGPNIFEKLLQISKTLATFFENPENWKLLQIDKGLRKDLFDFADAMETLKTELLTLEDVAVKSLEELKKKRKELKKEKREG